MNSDEFQRWWVDFARHFPSVNKWLLKLNELSADGSYADQQRGFWEVILKGVSFRDAMTVNGLMHAEQGEYIDGKWRGGDFPPVGSFDVQRERTAAHVLGLCLKLKRRREDAAKSKEITEPMFTHQTKTHTGVLAKVTALVISGLSTVEAVDQIFGPGDPENEQRFACLLCQDTGRVYLWKTPYCYKAWLSNVIDQRKHQKFHVRPCSCSQGSRFIPDTVEVRHGDREWYRYSPERDCLECPLEEFKTWCLERHALEAAINKQRFELDNPEQTQEMFT